MSRTVDLSNRIYSEVKQSINESAQFNVFEYIESFPLYTGTHTLARYLHLYDKFKECLPLAGDIVEFGVWRGATSLFFLKMLALMQPNTSKRVVLFDNFSGLPEPVSEDSTHAKVSVGEYRGDYEKLVNLIAAWDLTDLCHIEKGDAMFTIDRYEAQTPHRLVSLALLDFDLYAPTKRALAFLRKRLVTGGIIALDEGASDIWKGEGQAMVEFLSESGDHWEVLSNPLTRQPEIFLRKLS